MKPRIRIINEDGIGHNTRIFARTEEDGEEVDISHSVQEIDLHLKVGEINTAKITALLLGAEIDAEIIELQTKVLPPPLPKVKYRLHINEADNLGRHQVSLHRETPLPTYGVAEDRIFSVLIADVGFCAPLELVFEEEA